MSSDSKLSRGSSKMDSSGLSKNSRNSKHQLINLKNRKRGLVDNLSEISRNSSSILTYNLANSNLLGSNLDSSGANSGLGTSVHKSPNSANNSKFQTEQSEAKEYKRRHKARENAKKRLEQQNYKKSQVDLINNLGSSSNLSINRSTLSSNNGHNMNYQSASESNFDLMSTPDSVIQGSSFKIKKRDTARDVCDSEEFKQPSQIQSFSNPFDTPKPVKRSLNFETGTSSNANLNNPFGFLQANYANVGQTTKSTSNSFNLNPFGENSQIDRQSTSSSGKDTNPNVQNHNNPFSLNFGNSNNKSNLISNSPFNRSRHNSLTQNLNLLATTATSAAAKSASNSSLHKVSKLSNSNENLPNNNVNITCLHSMGSSSNRLNKNSSSEVSENDPNNIINVDSNSTTD